MACSSNYPPQWYNHVFPSNLNSDEVNLFACRSDCSKISIPLGLQLSHYVYTITVGGLSSLWASLFPSNVCYGDWDVQNTPPQPRYASAKQVGCFNHRVVTWLQTNLTVVMRSSLLVLKTNYIRQPKRQLPSSSYQPQYTDNPQNICEGVFTNAIESCSKELPCSQCVSKWFLTDVLKVVSVLWL